MSFRLSEGNPRGQRHALPLHEAVLAAIRAGNAPRAREAMLVLLADARNDVASVLGIGRKRMATVRTAPERNRRYADRRGGSK